MPNRYSSIKKRHPYPTIPKPFHYTDNPKRSTQESGSPEILKLIRNKSLLMIKNIQKFTRELLFLSLW